MNIFARNAQALVALLILFMVGCQLFQTEAEKRYDEAVVKEVAEGISEALPLYEQLVQDHPDTESATKARTKILEYQQMREQQAVMLFNEAESESEEEALTTYRRIVKEYADTEISSIAQSRIEQILAQRRATLFSDHEYSEVQQGILEAHENLGEGLLSRTHPTGTYGYTENPTVSRSLDKKKLTARFVVHWQGISETAYKTIYSLTFSKANKNIELDRLEVAYDNALFKIDPGLLKSTELDLRILFRSSPAFE